MKPEEISYSEKELDYLMGFIPLEDLPYSSTIRRDNEIKKLVQKTTADLLEGIAKILAQHDSEANNPRGNS